MTIRVLVVDDHAVVRRGLRRVLDAEPDIETVGEAANADRAIFEAMEHKPDVVLMDVTMPGKSGIEALPALLQARAGHARSSCSRCRTTRDTSEPPSRPGRAATC